MQATALLLDLPCCSATLGTDPVGTTVEIDLSVRRTRELTRSPRSTGAMCDAIVAVVARRT
jgi:hypothetical protein